MSSHRAIACTIAAVLAANASAEATNAAAPAASSGYNLPPPNVLAVLQAPSPPSPYVSPTSDTILLVSWVDYPPMSRVATPFLKLAGVRLEPGNHSKHDTPGGYGITPCARSFELVHVPDGAKTAVALPAGSCANAPRWSADGKRFAFMNLAPAAVELWIGDAATGQVHRVPDVKLNPMFGYTVQWMPDQASLLVKLVPAGMGPPPPEPVAPMGPSIEESIGGKGQSSTYENRDTLNNRHDEDLFDYYAASQLAFVDAATSAITPAGQPGNYDSVNAAPDGRHVLVEAIHKPYSYVTTYDRFARDVQIWDVGNRAQPAIRTLFSIPLADRVPIHGVRTGPRDFDWRGIDPATLVWAEALDGGDWNAKVPERDKVMLLRAPFTAPPVEIARLQQRFQGFAWTDRIDTALLFEYDENRHWSRTFIADVDDPKATPSLLWDLSSDDNYKDPGSPVVRELANGVGVVRMDGDAIWLAGTGSSPDGDRPFLDRLDLKTRKSERLFRSDRASFERFLDFAPLPSPSGRGTEGEGSGARGGSGSPNPLPNPSPGGRGASSDEPLKFLTWHQSPSDPPNAFLRTITRPVADSGVGEPAFASDTKPVTHIPDPTPQVRAIHKRLVHYKRADGLDLSFTLYTPPGYREGTRVPTILYAYPLDYADPSMAGQVTGSQYTFTRLRDYRLLLMGGYAIIDDASFPVVGDPAKAYDTYLEQLVADAKAAVDEAVKLGVADPDRIGVTGHSHGALMTVNLVAHSDLFRAGVATSGSYNKTLTPFGFQSERRSVWEAPEVYRKVSPFFSADTLKTPLLIIHGADDANPGTTPLQASKLFEAIRGNGGTARLVLLPHEPHWYSAMESNEQEIYEMLRWFDTYVKDAKPRVAKAAAAATR